MGQQQLQGAAGMAEWQRSAGNGSESPPSDQYLHHVRQILDSGCSNRVWRETRVQAHTSEHFQIACSFKSWNVLNIGHFFLHLLFPSQLPRYPGSHVLANQAQLCSLSAVHPDHHPLVWKMHLFMTLNSSEGLEGGWGAPREEGCSILFMPVVF